jgi:hypothetical protein
MGEQAGYDPRVNWRTAAELPEYVFEVLNKRDRAINPVTIVATVDENGAPRTAPFGSARAITPSLVRLISLRYHDTYKNLCQDGRVAVALVAPPHVAVSITGRAELVKEKMDCDEHHAVLDIHVESVKNDMVRSGTIGSAITFFPHDELKSWFDAVLKEIEHL